MFDLRFVSANVGGMAIKSIVVSDVSGKDVPEDQHVRVVVKHPDYSTPLEFDAALDETNMIVETTLRLVEFTIYAPNARPRTAIVETKVIDKLIPNFDEVLQGARKAEVPSADGGVARRGRRPRGEGGSAPRGDRLDYTDLDNIGLIHRGKVTEEEARLVRENMSKANENRARAGQPKIGDDPKDAARYGL